MINMKTWARSHRPEDKMLWKAPFHAQMEDFIHIEQALYGVDPDAETAVISTHVSKSIELPVVHVRLPAFGLEFVARHNFYDWNIAVRGGSLAKFSRKQVGREDTPDKDKGHIFYQGFPHEWRHPYDGDDKGFTVWAPGASGMFMNVILQQVVGKLT